MGFGQQGSGKPTGWLTETALGLAVLPVARSELAESCLLALLLTNRMNCSHTIQNCTN